GLLDPVPKGREEEEGNREGQRPDADHQGCRPADRQPGQLRRRRQRYARLDDEDDGHDPLPPLTPPPPEASSGRGKAHTPAVARAPLYAVVALLAAVALPSAGAAAKGDEHVLVILASAGSK